MRAGASVVGTHGHWTPCDYISKADSCRSATIRICIAQSGQGHGREYGGRFTEYIVTIPSHHEYKWGMAVSVREELINFLSTCRK